MTLVDKSKFSVSPYSKRVEKPWGFELLVTPDNSPVVGKIAFTKAGSRWSLQFHEQKEETITLFSGEAEIWLESSGGKVEKIKMEEKKGYSVKPFQKHRFGAITDCWTFEVSTPEKGNTVRVEDDYDRGTETEEDRKQR